MGPSSSVLDKTFSALADPTRRAILSWLALGESSVGELVKPFETSGETAPVYGARPLSY